MIMEVMSKLLSFNVFGMYLLAKGFRCMHAETCRKVLRAEAEERNIQLSEEDEKLSPTLLAKKIFSKYSGML